MRTITVRGKGKISQEPDWIEVSLILRGEDSDYETALGKEEQMYSSLSQALVQNGFIEEKLKTADYQVETRYEGSVDEQGVYRNHFAGYSCIHSLKLEFPLEMQRLNLLFNAVSVSLADPELSIQFTIKDKEAMSDELLARAAEDAGKRAGVLTRAMGVELGQLVSIEYDFSAQTPYSPTFFRMTGKKSVRNGTANEEMVPENIQADDSAVFIWEIRGRS